MHASGSRNDQPCPKAMNLEPLGLLGGRGRRDDPSAQEAGELQRKQRNTAGALGQHRIACNDPAPARESDPGGYRSTGQARGFLEREVARHVHQRLLAQHGIFRQHPVEIGAEPVSQVVGADPSAKPARMEAASNSIADLDPGHPGADGSHLTSPIG